MATALQPQPVIAPLPEQNRVASVGQVSGGSIAQSVLDGHVAGLRSRREDDLLAEKLVLHVDGSGDSQWADIFMGQRVEIPRTVSDFRKTENVLRLVVNNAVAHHTSTPLRYQAMSAPDRKSKIKAMVDTIWMNHVVKQQHLNALFADALYMAMPARFCPVHVYWRYSDVDGYEPVEYATGGVGGAVPGILDCWTGNPFDTVFDRGAKRGSIHWASYGRVLPAELVRQAFQHVPAARAIEGSTRMPSAAIFQRIAKSWNMGGLGVHGSPIIGHRREVDEYDELIQLVCREVLPGVDPMWPKGRLQIIAVPGGADLRVGTPGKAILLADQELPAGDFSFSLFYSDHRGDDVHGRPWIGDLDGLQVDLNIANSHYWEYAKRAADAPIVAPGGAIGDDMADFSGYGILEVEASIGGWQPRVMEWPAYVAQMYERIADQRRQAIFTGGGYQAVSRGESPGTRTPYRAIVALQQADNTIHGPVNERFKLSAIDFALKCWKQMKTYGDVPWLVALSQDEYSYLADPYIDSTKLSDRPPTYELVNSFGSAELRSQEILELMGTRGADGEAFLPTEIARRLYPNPLILGDLDDAKQVRRRRAKTIAETIQHLAFQYREQTGMTETDPMHPWVQEAAMQVFSVCEKQYPRLQDDDLQAHIDSLSEITQDEQSDAIARLAAIRRQALYFQWQAMMAMGAVPGSPAPTGQPGSKPGVSSVDRRGIAAEVQSGGARGGAVEAGSRSAVAATAR